MYHRVRKHWETAINVNSATKRRTYMYTPIQQNLCLSLAVLAYPKLRRYAKRVELCRGLNSCRAGK